jgi:hypothetical protein
MLGGITAYMMYRKFRYSTPLPLVLRDPNFKTTNLQLYSAEAETRAAQISDVQYKLLLKLTTEEETGYAGSYQATFKMKETPKQDAPLFLDF